jgi:hypothetical protein
MTVKWKKSSRKPLEKKLAENHQENKFNVKRVIFTRIRALFVI